MLAMIYTRCTHPHASIQGSLSAYVHPQVRGQHQLKTRENNRYGFYAEARVSHARPGMYTYRIEIIPPSAGTGKTLSSVKPGTVLEFYIHTHVRENVKRAVSCDFSNDVCNVPSLFATDDMYI
jgi:hypothetical protein